MIIRVKHKNNFTTISNKALQDKELSFRSRGLLAYLLSLPEDWKLYENEIKDHSTDKRTAIHTAMLELLNSGYVFRGVLKQDNTYDYFVNDAKLSNDEWNTYAENQQGVCWKSARGLVENQQSPHVEKQHTPFVENQQLQNTQVESTEEQNTHSNLDLYFISLWQSEPTVVNCMARLKSPNDWAEYWRLYQGTREDIKRSWDNFIAGVKTGVIERRFVPANPDTFILGDGLNRYRDPPQKKAGPKIGKDSVDDVSQFFKGVADADT
ncbi:hypothetical protein AGMMS49944_03700 [Spirochaetia bacterium]|nr:hypothetical protein AGMMS49944_03700 [Spirochaetia bacterium]